MKPENCESIATPPSFCEDFPESCVDGEVKGGNLFPSRSSRMEESTVTQEVIGEAGHGVYPLVSECSFLGMNITFDFCKNATFQSFMFEDLKGKMKKCYILNALWAKAVLNLPQVPTRTILQITVDLEPEEYRTETDGPARVAFAVEHYEPFHRRFCTSTGKNVYNSNKRGWRHRKEEIREQ